MEKLSVSKLFSLIAGVVDTAVINLYFRIYPKNVVQIVNGSNKVFMSMGELNCENPEAENLVADSL
jgi:hypothetical protein